MHQLFSKLLFLNLSSPAHIFKELSMHLSILLEAYGEGRRNTIYYKKGSVKY